MEPGSVNYADAVVEVTVDTAAFQAARDAYGAETARLEAQFKADLFKELGIENNPKRDKLFSKAWELGHSSGYSEVYSYADDLVELILDEHPSRYAGC
jgi:hypothetical protein